MTIWAWAFFFRVVRKPWLRWKPQHLILRVMPQARWFIDRLLHHSLSAASTNADCEKKQSWKASWTLSPWQYDEMYQLIIVWHPPGRCYKGSFPILICKDQRSRDMTSPSLFVFICFRLPAETLMPVSVSLFLTEAGVPLSRWQHRLHFAWEKRDSESEERQYF